MKKLLLSLFTALVSVTPATAGVYEDHDYLINQLERVGVTVTTNSKFHCNGSVAGAYMPRDRVIVICKGREWDDWDLDTLRHEAHHVVQDCNDGDIGDGLLSPMFDRKTLKWFISESLTEKEIQNVFELYRESDDYTQLLELETFAVAKSVDPVTIGDKVVEFCGIINR